jgi:DNA-binding HxlR family transcriptional regulator
MQIDNQAKKSPIETGIDIISGKWKALILVHLMKRLYRFTELKRQLPNVSQRMLSNQLRELEADGLVHREVYAQVPPKVEYSLTKLGKSVHSVLQELNQLGENVELCRDKRKI